MDSDATAIKLLLGDTPEEAKIIELIAKGVSDDKDLLDKSGVRTQIFSQTMTMLELSGKIKSLGADHWSLS